MEYRAAQKQDIPGMARIRAESWETESYWIPRIEAYLAGRHSPQKALAPRAAFIAVEADQVAGVVSGHLTTRFDCEGEVQWMNVGRAWQGRGIGGELVRRQAAWFVAQGARRVCVNVEPDNATARAFYGRHGATPKGTHWLEWDDIGAVVR